MSSDPPPDPPPEADLPPPDPPPDANVPPPDPAGPRLRQRGRLTDPTGQPKTDAPARRERRERIVVMTFLWGTVAVVALLILLALL